MNWARDNFLVSDDKSKLKVSEIHVIMQQGEWCAHYSPEQIDKLLNNSFWLGLRSDGQLIGFARMVTDKETVTLITDFIIHEAHREKGLGSWLMTCLVDHSDLRKTSISLGTPDKDNFFKKFGFERLGCMMHRFQQPPLPTLEKPRQLSTPPKGSIG